MDYYNRQPAEQNEDYGKAVYHSANGFYRHYEEPAWEKEKRLIRNTGNGIGFASLGYMVLSFFSGAISLIFTQLFYSASNIHGLYYLTETVDWILNLAVYLFSLLIPFGIYVLFIKMPLRVAIPLQKAKSDLTFSGVLICLGACVLASYATNVLQIGLECVGIGITMPEYVIPETVPGLIIYAVSLTVVPAFAEEIVFRGIIMQSLRRFGDIFALVASAFIFGIFHLNLIQMPYALIVGLCIGYFVMRTGSLWIGIILHFINNSVALAFELLYPYITEETYLMSNLLYNLISVILAVIALVVILAKYNDMFRFEKAPGVLSPDKKATYFLSSPALILSMVYAFLLTLPNIHFI